MTLLRSIYVTKYFVAHFANSVLDSRQSSSVTACEREGSLATPINQSLMTSTLVCTLSTAALYCAVERDLIRSTRIYYQFHIKITSNANSFH